MVLTHPIRFTKNYLIYHMCDSYMKLAAKKTDISITVPSDYIAISFGTPRNPSLEGRQFPDMMVKLLLMFSIEIVRQPDVETMEPD